MMEDVKETEGAWKGNNAIEIFLKNSVSDHVPRKLTGEWRTGMISGGNIMCVQTYYTLPQVMRRLNSENFLSCPVLDGHKYVGMISMLDLVSFTTKMFWGDTKEEWVEFWEKSEVFKRTQVSEIIQFPSTNECDPFPPLHPEMTSLYALELFARTDTKRSAVVDNKTHKVKNVVTQSMLISFIRQNKEKLSSLLSKQVRDITAPSMLQRDDPSFEASGPSARFNMVHTINQTDKAINAFNKMVNEKVSAVAIVDDDGVLTGNISIRDLRGVGADGENFRRLFDTVKVFKQKTRQAYPRQAPYTHYSSKHVPHGGYFVTPTDSLESVLDLMNDGNIHRVYVCTSESLAAACPKPIGVISQRDMLMEVLQFLQTGIQYPKAQAPEPLVID